MVARIYPDGIDNQKVEVAIEFAKGIPAYSRKSGQIDRTFEDLGEYFNITLPAESREEIFCDKIVAFGQRHYRELYPFKARDVYDICKIS